jgi:hypothetical protein
MKTPAGSERLRGIEQPVNERGSSPSEELKGDREISADQSAERPRDITEIVGEINAIRGESYAARKSIADRDAKLNTLREGMGMLPKDMITPATEFQEGRIEDLQKRERELIAEAQDWLRSNGRENLPNGIVIDTEDGGFEVKGGSFDDIDKEEVASDRKRDDLELRRQWLRNLKEEVARNSERALREDWRTKDAVNLGLTIELMKRRIPGLIENKLRDFLSGKLEEPPFDTVWVRWKISSSLLERIVSRPNQVTSVDILFDEDDVKLADDKELNEVPPSTPSAHGSAPPS